MTIAEKLEYTYRRVLTAPDSDQELALLNEFIAQLGQGEALADTVRYFTTRLDDVIAKLRQITIQHKMPGQLARIENPQVWCVLAWALIDGRLIQVARELFAAMYEFQLSQQAEMRRRCYKGVSLMNLSWTDYLAGDLQAARRAARLALVEEVFNTLDMDEATQLRVVSSNPAYQMLRQTLKTSVGELDYFVRFARDFSRRYPERCAYPEDCFVGYLRAQAAGTAHRAADDRPRVSHFNHAYFTTLLDMVGRATSPTAAESLLADLICYLFATVNDLHVIERGPSPQAEGFDLIVRNAISDDPVLAGLGAHIGVDWRHWAGGVNSELLMAITARLHLSGLHTAVIFERDSDANISESMRARSLACRLYQQEQIVIVIVQQTDIYAIERRQVELPALLKQKIEALRFNRHADLDRPLIIEPPAIKLHASAAESKPVPMTPVYPVAPVVPQMQPQMPAQVPVPQPIPQPVAQQFHEPVSAPPVPYNPPSPPPPPPATAPDHQNRPPRLVIRNARSAPKPIENIPQPAYKPIVIKNPEPPLLKPCTSCQNQTSLMCKTCQKPFCNMHISLPALLCDECQKAPAATVEN